MRGAGQRFSMLPRRFFQPVEQPSDKVLLLQVAATGLQYLQTLCPPERLQRYLVCATLGGVHPWTWDQHLLTTMELSTRYDSMIRFFYVATVNVDDVRPQL